MPLGQTPGSPASLSRELDAPRFRHHLWSFDTSSAVRFRSPLQVIHDGIKSRLLLQRSPPSLLTTAARSGLTPAPECRRRGAYPHLSYSSTPPIREACS